MFTQRYKTSMHRGDRIAPLSYYRNKVLNSNFFHYSGYFFRFFYLIFCSHQDAVTYRQYVSFWLPTDTPAATAILNHDLRSLTALLFFSFFEELCSSIISSSLQQQSQQKAASCQSENGYNPPSCFYSSQPKRTVVNPVAIGELRADLSDLARGRATLANLLVPILCLSLLTESAATTQCPFFFRWQNDCKGFAHPLVLYGKTRSLTYRSRFFEIYSSLLRFANLEIVTPLET